MHQALTSLLSTRLNSHWYPLSWSDIPFSEKYRSTAPWIFFPTVRTMFVCCALVLSLFSFRNVLYSCALIESICDAGTRLSCLRPVTGTVEQEVTRTLQKTRR